MNNEPSFLDQIVDFDKKKICYRYKNVYDKLVPVFYKDF